LNHVADPSGSHTGSEGAGAAGAYVDPASARAAVSRGRFLSGVTLGLGGLLGAAVTVPVIGFALGPSFAGEEWYWTDLGPLDQYNDEYTPVIFERGPNGHIDRRVAFIRRDGDNAVTAISNTCMHLGCPVVTRGGAFACPCHGGQYDSEGRRTIGPPVRPLNRFETQITAEGHLLLGRVFAAEEKGGEVVLSTIWKDPGQQVEGLLSFLYPAPPR
jgi:Rieske Fe-S protein